MEFPNYQQFFSQQQVQQPQPQFVVMSNNQPNQLYNYVYNHPMYYYNPNANVYLYNHNTTAITASAVNTTVPTVTAASAMDTTVPTVTAASAIDTTTTPMDINKSEEPQEITFEHFCNSMVDDARVFMNDFREPKEVLPKKYKNYVTKISLLENLTHQYYCTICNNYSTDSLVRFYKHITDNHPYKDAYYCYYCCKKVDKKDYGYHIMHHFSPEYINKDYCRLCCNWIDISDEDHTEIIKHIQTDHTNIELGSVCVFCQREFHELDDLKSHLSMAHQKLYSCSDSKCRVMTHNEDNFNQHRLRCVDHGEIQVQFYLNCGDNERLGVPEFDLCCLISPSKKITSTVEIGVELPADLTQSVCEEFTKLECIRGIKMDFSDRVLKKLYRNEEEYKNIREKMMEFRGKYICIGYELSDSTGLLKKRCICTICNHCNFSSQADIKRHIMKHHCQLSPSELKICMPVTSSNKLSVSLATDKEMICNINRERNDVASDLKALSDSEEEDCDDECKPNNKRKFDEINKKKELPSELVPQYSQKCIQEIQNRQLITENEAALLKDKLPMLSQYRAIFIRTYSEEGENKENQQNKKVVRTSVRCSGCDKMDHLKGAVHYSTFLRHVINFHLNMPMKLRKFVLIATKVDRNLELIEDSKLITMI